MRDRRIRVGNYRYSPAWTLLIAAAALANIAKTAWNDERPT